MSEGLVSEVVRFEVMPDDFDVVKFRCVFRQPLDGEPMRSGGKGGEREFADMDRAIVLDEHDGPGWVSGFWSVETVELFKMSDEVAAALGRAGMNDEVSSDMIKRPQHRHFLGLSRCRHAQVRAGPRPRAGKIGMRQRLAFVAIEKDDIATLGLTLSQLQTQSDPINLAGGLRATPFRVFRRFPVLVDEQAIGWERAGLACGSGAV